MTHNVTPLTKPFDGTIAIAADHGGFRLKSFLIAELSGMHTLDLGTRNDTESVDVQDYALAVVKSIFDGYAMRGIIICRSGHMASFVANRFPFIRAAICHTPELAVAARSHNDANVLCLPADYMDEMTALATVRLFMATSLAAEPRYHQRLEKLAALDLRQFDKD